MEPVILDFPRFHVGLWRFVVARNILDLLFEIHRLCLYSPLCIRPHLTVFLSQLAFILLVLCTRPRPRLILIAPEGSGAAFKPL
jgi:hypothetical protein